MKRITEHELQCVVDRINRVTNSPQESYIKIGNEYVSQAGNYHLDHAYGGVNLCRMVGPTGGTSDVFRCGHITKRDLYNRMQAFLTALEPR